MPSIQFQCSGCQSLLEVDENYRGCQAACPKCGTQTTVSDIAPVEPMTASVVDLAPGSQAYSPFMPVMPMPPRTDSYGVASFVCSLIGLVFGILLLLPFFLCIPGIILGHVSLSNIKNSDGRLGGRGFAIAGLVIGYLPLFLLVLGIVAFMLTTGSGEFR